MLNDAIGNHKNVKTWIKAYARMKDGRGAWEAFNEHFLGTNQMDAIEASAEKQLATLDYRGEKPRYNFETHVSKHLRAHLDIAKEGGVLNERQRVRKLVDSLQASTLVAEIAQVRANDKFLDSFDQTVSYLCTFIIATDQVETRNVASVEGEGKGKKRVHFEKGGKKKYKNNKKGKFTNSKGKGRFYKPEEWLALSQKKLDEIIEYTRENEAQTSSVNTESDKEDSTQVSSTQTSQRR